MTYAAKTAVSVEKSRNDIERTLARYGAQQFMYGWDTAGAVVAFVIEPESEQRRQVRFKLPLPPRDAYEFTHSSRGRRSTAAAEAAWEQACRQRWRALLLVVKAKLEAVESGISSFEEEFLAYIMLPDGETVGEWITPQIAEVYEKGSMPSGLPMLELGPGS